MVGVEKLNRQERILASALGFLAGFVDAIGFLAMGGFFVSFMSGNTTRMGVGLAEATPDALTAATLIASFLAGVVIGSLLGHAAGPRRKPNVLLLVALLLAAAPLIEQFVAHWIALAVVAAAMGAVNAIFEHQGDVRFGLTYMTGALVKAGQRIAAALRGGDRFAWGPYLLQWLMLAAGAVLGALSHPWLGLAALWLASAASVLLAAFAATLRTPHP